MVAATMKRTPLHAIHARLGAKLVPFGGYEMPVSYAAGITAEHRAVREAVGVFDVSHMGEFEVTGPDRNAFVQRITCHDVGALRPGPGPDTGYTGEDGFELYCRGADLERLWDALVGPGRGAPCGLGARDTLRLEAGYPLYGSDIDDTVTPFEAGLGWIVKLEKGADFVGLAALKRQRLEGVGRPLGGFRAGGPKSVAPHSFRGYLVGPHVGDVPGGALTPTTQTSLRT